MEVSKKDWSLFRERLPMWQERYMEKLNQEYIDLLSSGQGNASDRFWMLDKRIREDKHRPGVRLELRKQNMPYDLAHLLEDGTISLVDLDGFSKELLDIVQYLTKHDFEP